MTKRMLIDDTQSEETRVVVVNGNKLEDVEFESSNRKQIKGNIYLAKVMRIEPSLQAAFVDYGGNRHGFLAFSEIHPDYYYVDQQIITDLEKEVNEIIENKKQTAKEKEQERIRLRQERALKYMQKLQQEAQQLKDQEENQINQPEKEQVLYPDTSVSKTEEELSSLSSNSSAASEFSPKEENDDKPVRRRGRRPKIKTQQTENNIENPSNNEDFKTLSEACGADEDKIVEEENNSLLSRHNADNNNDEDAVDDDDDDNEYDYEIQKKLLFMRKLFYQSKIQDVIKEGQVILVQVVKEERGNKGAALTTYLSLAGRYCVLMPNRIKSGGVSRKITNTTDRKRLKNIIHELPMPNEMSLIVRTAGEEKTKADIVRDYNYLIRTWNQIRLDALKKQPPTLIYEEGNLIKRALRDMFTKEISEIIIDGDKAYHAACDFMKILSPHSMKKLKSCKTTDIPLFQRFQVEGQLDKLHDTNVQLESGGYLVINPTEALVSIDVNSGRATKEKDLEETALKTNLEAADEIAKQLRMRNLAGLVVIDFIDMEDPKNNQAIEKRMKEAMKKDRARVQIGKMSCFGLLEISRQRMHSSFIESNYRPCPCCHGRGIVRTIESGAVSILRTLEEEGIKNRSSKITVFLPRDISVYLLNQKRYELVAIEQRYKMQIIIAADENIQNISDFKIERTKLPKQSENQVKEIETPQITDITNNTSLDKEDKSQKTPLNNEYRKNSRRGHFDRRKNNDRRRYDETSEETNNKRTPENEPVILYDSQENAINKENEPQPEKRKIAWWKKLING